MSLLSTPGTTPWLARAWRPRAALACCAMLALAAPVPAHPSGIERLLALPLERLLNLVVVCAAATQAAHPEACAAPATHNRGRR